jgi:hypothetical protein
VIVVVVAIIAVATGFVNLHGTSGSLPKVAIEGGALPGVKADVGSIDIGTKNSSVEVPKVDVGTIKKTVEVPTVAINKPN